MSEDRPRVLSRLSSREPKSCPLSVDAAVTRSIYPLPGERVIEDDSLDHRTPRTSEMMAALPDAFVEDNVTIGDLVAALRNRVFGLGILLFGAPNILPMPPGIPAACGAVLMLLGLQLAAGRSQLWLPNLLRRRSISRATLRMIADRSMPWIQRFERISRPRLDIFAAPAASRTVGVMIFLLGLVLLMPFPFLGNVPPAIAACILALGLIERDGVIVLVGFVASAIAVAITGGTTWLIFKGAMWFF